MNLSIILIEKDGTISEKQIKTLDKLYSICGYRTNKDFEKIHEWKFDENVYELYGKTSGKKDKENNFHLPIDSDKTYFGSLCIVKKNGSISLDEWNIFYMSFTYESKYEEPDESVDTNESVEYQKCIEKNEVELELTYEEYEEEP
jgi:hypothetical protein